MEVEKEIWRNISGCPDYQVSNLGRVKSMERKVKGKFGSIRTLKEKILKPRKNRYNYLQVFLCKEGNGKNMYIHRLVCDAFIPNPYNLPEINHKDENPLNNNVENLEYCDRLYNCNYGNRNNRISKSNTNGKKSKAVICLETGLIYSSTREIQRQSGFKQSSISQCCNGKRKTCGGYHWKYVE